MAENESCRSYTELMLRDALSDSAVMKMLLQGGKYPDGVHPRRRTPDVEPPLDLSYSRGTLPCDEDKAMPRDDLCKRCSDGRSLDSASKRKCVRCDFVALDADTSFRHYQFHRQLRSGLDWRRSYTEQSSGSQQCTSEESSTLRTLLRGCDKPPVFRAGSTSCARSLIQTSVHQHEANSETVRISSGSSLSSTSRRGYFTGISSPPIVSHKSDVLDHNVDRPPPDVSSQGRIRIDYPVESQMCEKEEHGDDSSSVNYVTSCKQPKTENAVDFSVLPPTGAAGAMLESPDAPFFPGESFTPLTSPVIKSEVASPCPVGVPTSSEPHPARYPESRKDCSVQCNMTSRKVSDCMTSEAPCRCQHCGIVFDDDVMYSIHMGCHNHRDPFICNVCGKGCHNKYTFYTHIMRGHEYR